MKVYLAGPISGLSYGKSIAWRDEVKQKLFLSGIKAYSPLRGKSYLSSEKTIEGSYEDKIMSSASGINVRDFNDVKTCDALFVNLLGTERVSIGTVMEVAWARAFNIPVVLVLEKGSVHDHVMITYGCLVTNSVDEGVWVIKQLLLP